MWGDLDGTTPPPSAAEAASEFCVIDTHPPLGVCSRRTDSCSIMRVVLLVLALTAVCNGILPEIVHPGVTHILGDYYGQTGQPELDDESVEVEQRSEDLQPAAKDAARPVGILRSVPSHLTTEHCI